MGRVILFGLAGYIVGALIGIGLVQLLSTKHDKSVEAPMTGFFVTGPIGAVLALIAAFVLH
ncbi:MAG: hypothetical protein U0133_20210 [Gemmatimonadales bacterium]